MRYALLLLLLLSPLACKGKTARATDDDAVGTGPATRDSATPVEDSIPTTLPPAPEIPVTVRGLPPLPSPDYNPTTPAKAALGRLLFFDPRLSVNRSMSCGTCHNPDFGWADSSPLSRTVTGELNRRHTPTLLNVGYSDAFFWDGRMPTLEAVILSNWKGQMAADPAAVAALLSTIPLYRLHFERAFRDGPSPPRIAEALAAFVRTIRSGDAPFDAYEAGDSDAVSAQAIAGAAVFTDRAGCGLCHSPPLYTDGQYHNLGIPDYRLPDAQLEPLDIDQGRYRVTKDPHDTGAFRTPGLRGLRHTAPYFHNGTATKLRQACHLEGDVHLTETEMQQLEAFLDSLSADRKPYQRPTLPKDPPPPAAESGIVRP